MPNEWNKLISGALQGGSNIAQGLFQKRDNEQSAQLYNKTLQSLNELFDKYTTQPNKEQIANQKIADVSRLNVQTYDTEKFGSPAIIEKNPYTLSELYKKVSDAKIQLATQYGETGKLRADELSNYFSSLLKNENRKIIETKDGIYSYNPDNAGSFRLEVPFSKKEEKKIYNAGDYNKMTLEDINNLPDSEIAKGFHYFNADVKNKLFEMYPDLKQEYDIKLRQGEFEPKQRGRTSYRSSRKINTKLDVNDRALYDDLKTISKGDVEEEDIIALANKLDVPPNEIKQMAKEVSEGNNFKKVKQGLIDKQESIPYLMKQLGLDILRDDLFNTETDPNKNGDVNLIFDKEDNAMQVISDNYDIIPDEIKQMIIRKIINIFNEVRRSKGLPDYEL